MTSLLQGRNPATLRASVTGHLVYHEWIAGRWPGTRPTPEDDDDATDLHHQTVMADWCLEMRNRGASSGVPRTRLRDVAQVQELCGVYYCVDVHSKMVTDFVASHHKRMPSTAPREKTLRLHPGGCGVPRSAACDW